MISIDRQNGTSTVCQVSISETLGLTTWYNTIAAGSKSFSYNHTFVSLGDTTSLIGGRCWNRLNLPIVVLAPVTIDVRQAPKPMTNFSLELSKPIVQTGESFYLYVIFLNGTHMNCSVISTSAGISHNFIYDNLVAFQQVYSNSRKAYRLTFSSAVFSLGHRIDVVCRNILKEVAANITIQVQIPVSGISSDVPSFACFGPSFLAKYFLTQGAPIHKKLFIDSVQKSDYYSVHGKDNNFTVTSGLYGASGVKSIHSISWNDVSSLTSKTKQIRIAKTILSVTVNFTFTLTSSQALSARPLHVVPTSEWVFFTMFVTPAAAGYIYHWSMNGPVVDFGQTVGTAGQYIFSTPGAYSFRVVTDGCNNFTYDANLTVNSPIEDFSVYFSPTPEVVVNKTVLIYIAVAVNSECLKLDFGDGSAVISHCNASSDASELKSCFVANAVCQVSHVYRARGNFTIKVTASNGLFERIKETLLVAKTCYDPILTVQGKVLSLDDFSFCFHFEFLYAQNTFSLESQY